MKTTPSPWLARGLLALGSALLAAGCVSGGRGQASQANASLPALFQRLDTDGDGALSRDEFKRLSEMGWHRSADVFEKLFGRLDADASGALSLDEFKGLAALQNR